MACLYNGILFSYLKEWNSVTYYNIDNSQKYYTKLKKPDTEEQVLYDSTHMKHLEQANLLRKKVDWMYQALGWGK